MAEKKYLDEVGLQTVANNVNTRLKTVTTMPNSATNGAVRLYVGNTGTYIKGHTYQYNSTSEEWNDITPITDISSKADKVVSAINGDLAGLDSNGNLIDSGILSSNVVVKSNTTGLLKNDGTVDTNTYATTTALEDKADKVASATANDIATLNSSGNLTDSGINSNIFPSGATSSNKLATANDIPTELNDLSDDVVITTPVNNQILAYNSTSGKWENKTGQIVIGSAVFKGSILFANLPTTGMENGDWYDIKDAFVTDSTFEEGAGIACAAGTDVIWVSADNKWNILTPSGVYSFNGRTGAVVPASGDYTKSDVGLGNVVNTGDSSIPVSGGTTKFTTGGAYTELNKKTNKVNGSTNGDLAGLDGDGNLTDSGILGTDVIVKSDTAGLVKNDGTIDTSTYPNTFTGTQEQWNALTTAQKKEYEICNITDDIGTEVFYTKTESDATFVEKTDIASVEETSTASAPYEIGDEFYLNNILYKVTDTISINDPIVVGTNCQLADSITEQINSKQDNLTFDNTPTASSVNPVKSGGIYNAIGWSRENLVTSFDTWNIGSDGIITSDNSFKCAVIEGHIGDVFNISQNVNTSPIVVAYFSSTPTIGSTSYNGSRNVYENTYGVSIEFPIDGYVVVRFNNSITSPQITLPSVKEQKADKFDVEVANQLLNDTVGWESYNLLPITLADMKRINSIGTWAGNVYTYGNIDYTVNTDKNGYVTEVIVNGNNSANSNIVLLNYNTKELDFSTVAGKSVIMSGCPSGGSAATYSIYGYRVGGGTINARDTGDEATFTFRSDNNTWNIAIAITTGASVNNLVFKPMLRYAIYKDLTEYYTYHASVDSCKVDNSVIASVEDGTTIQNPSGYAIGSHAIRNGAFITWKNAKAQGETIADSDYNSGDVANNLAFKGVISSTDDLNNYKSDGIYSISSAPSNSPESTGYNTMLVKKRGSTAHQIVWHPSTGIMYCRVFDGSSWSNWFKFAGTEIIP